MTASADQSLRGAADLFHEILSSLCAEDLIGNMRNAKIVESLREKIRSRDEIKKIASDGFELCVRSLAAAGAPDVTIHECGDQALGETPWSGGRDD